MNTKEIIKFGDREYEFLWNEGGEIPQQDVSQVSGYVFNDKGELLIVKSKNWTIPGGHPEVGETYIETLKREIMEEAMLDIDNIKYLGNVRVTDLETNEVKHQLRFTASVASIYDFIKEFETSERIFIEPLKLASYIPWANGKVFMLEIKSAIDSL